MAGAGRGASIEEELEMQLGMGIKRWFGYGWAEPATSRRWAFVASLLDALSALTGRRILGSAKHAAWCRATAQT